MNLENWIEHYRPIDNCSADSFEFVCDGHDRIVHNVAGDDLEAVRRASPDKVWTLIESDGVAMIVRGYHHVNRQQISFLAIRRVTQSTLTLPRLKSAARQKGA